ncbi:MAG: VanZ family protein [Candidatus Zixiibacteriota bacterium]
MLASFIICASYSALDEIHQYFVPNRNSDIYDFIADLVGILMSLLIILIHKKQSN